MAARKSPSTTEEDEGGRTLKRLSLQVAALVCAAALLAPAGALASSRQDRVERAITRTLNFIRVANGRSALRTSGHLARVADRHSRSMARRNTLTHAPPLAARVSRRRVVGETVAWMPRGTHGVARRVVEAWLASPAHRDALMDGRFHRVGVGRRMGRSGTFVTAELMG